MTKQEYSPDPFMPPHTIVSRYYTARGQLQSVGWGVGATSYVYWPDGKVNYQANTNGVTTTFGYDGRGMISSVAHINGAGQNLASRTYWRDSRDRITAWKRGTDYSQNVMENGLGDRYAYDEEGQLTSASYRAVNPDTTASNPMRSDIFSYDALGNRKGSNYVASRGSMNFTRRDNGLNQYLAWWPFSGIFYDDNFGGSWTWPGNGVTMADGWVTASFNALNQPVAIWCPAYPGGTSPRYMWLGYDPLGRCVTRWMGDATGGAAYNPSYFYYDGWNLVQEGITANNVARQYVHGGRVDEIVASQAGGVWNFHHYDARGHCILLTGTSAIIVEQYDYDAFGMPYFYDRFSNNIHSSGFGNRFLFTGREWLQDLRIYDFRNRMYQPELGRFLQPDPKEFGAGDYNLYRYCHNDPVNKSDPFGLEGLTIKGHGDWDFDNGRVAMAQIALQRSGGNRSSAASGSPNDVTINQLGKQLVADHDETTQGVPTKNGLQIAEGGTEVKKPKGGRATGTFGYTGAQEQLNLRKDADRLIHAHTRDGKRYALPTPDDDAWACEVRADHCAYLLDTLARAWEKVRMGIEEIILFITSQGRVVLTNHGQNIASIRGSHCNRNIKYAHANFDSYSSSFLALYHREQHRERSAISSGASQLGLC